MTNDLPLRRERDLGAIVSDSFTLLFAHFGSLSAIVFPAVVTTLALSLLGLAIEDDVAIFVLLVASLIVQLLVFQFVSSAGVVFLDSFDRQREIPPAESLDQAQQRIGIISAAALRAFLIVLALAITIVGLPWAIKRLVKWVFLSQMIMLEDRRSEDVLVSSAELVRGHWWSTAGRLLVTGIVVGIPTLMVSAVANAALPLTIAAFVDAGIVFVTVPYGIISTTLIYFDLKLRKDRNDSIRPV